MSDAGIQFDLDHLAGTQQADGGWPSVWEPHGEAAVLRWRGIATINALQTLVLYERWATPRLPDGTLPGNHDR